MIAKLFMRETITTRPIMRSPFEYSDLPESLSISIGDEYILKITRKDLTHVRIKNLPLLVRTVTVVFNVLDDDDRFFISALDTLNKIAGFDPYSTANGNPYVRLGSYHCRRYDTLKQWEILEILGLLSEIYGLDQIYDFELLKAQDVFLNEVSRIVGNIKRWFAQREITL